LDRRRGKCRSTPPSWQSRDGCARTVTVHLPYPFAGIRAPHPTLRSLQASPRPRWLLVQQQCDGSSVTPGISPSSVTHSKLSSFCRRKLTDGVRKSHCILKVSPVGNLKSRRAKTFSNPTASCVESRGKSDHGLNLATEIASRSVRKAEHPDSLREPGCDDGQMCSRSDGGQIITGANRAANWSTIRPSSEESI
jgi:hypothetical protein